MPLLEAMSCGAPTITTSESSLPEVGGDAPLYVDFDKPKSFAVAIENVLNDSKKREEMQKKSLEQAKNFSWKKTVDMTVKIYESIIT